MSADTQRGVCLCSSVLCGAACVCVHVGVYCMSVCVHVGVCVAPRQECVSVYFWECGVYLSM